MVGIVTSIIAVSTFLLTYEIGWICYCHWFHPLRSVPGPFLASITRIWLVYQTAKGDMHRTQRELHKKYGPVVRVAPDEATCADPEAIKTIYGHKSGFTKTKFYAAWTPPNNGYPGHFPVLDEKQHAERRRIVSHIYSMSSVLESEAEIDSCTRQFCEILNEMSESGVSVDLSLWLTMYAFDVLGELFYGRPFGFLTQRKDIGGYMDAIHQLLPTFTIGGTLPSYLTIPYYILSNIFHANVRGSFAAIGNLSEASHSLVKKRQVEVEEANDDRHDMLRKMFTASKEKGEKVNFGFDDILVESHSSIFAGADTTAIAIISVMYYLTRNPAANEKLLAESDTAAERAELSDPVSYSEAIKLPYLRACINEAMRMHPSVGFTMPRRVQPGGAVICEVYFPEGYTIGVNPAIVQYNEGAFGPDVNRFRPERWIEGDTATMERAMLSFGGGRRTCIGKNVALSQTYKIVPQLVRKFRFRLVDATEELQSRNYWFNRPLSVNVAVEKRESKSNSSL